MSKPAVIQQAVDLLKGRLAEATARRDQLTAEAQQLTDEIEAVTAALRSLNGQAFVAQVLADVGSATLSELASSGVEPRSIRAAVKDILDSERRPYTSTELREMLPEHLTVNKAPSAISNSVRSAVWSLTTKGDAIRVNDGDAIVSSKWPGFVASGTQNRPDDSESGNFRSEVEGGAL
ncbi:hypothetical protein [uncultured Jatrophihabitans sp.]|uniref:hypothetical protein n=1 Tax=uncultured Jatrophihabitans sp. TaxID=1610747 RepID=UPI0035CC5658